MKNAKLSLRIILIFTAIILLSFIPENFHQFFGDWHCNGGTFTVTVSGGYKDYSGCHYGDDGNYQHHLPQWHWGYRHWMWMFMGICLTITQAASLIKSIDNSEKE